MNNIDNLIKAITIRYACKNIDKYVAEVKKAIGIKLVLEDSDSLEFTWSKDFEWYVDAVNTKYAILNYFNQQKQKIFSTIDYDIIGKKLVFTFKFHPENAI